MSRVILVLYFAHCFFGPIAAALVDRVVCGAAFAVGMGLLLGRVFELPQPMNTVGGLLIAVLLLPTYLIGNTKIPLVGQAIRARIPSAASSTALVMLLAETGPIRELWINLGTVLLITILIYAATIWTIQHADR